MPAIQLTRLRQKTALLAGQMTQPGAYKRLLHELLDFYADRARRPGQAGAPPPLIAAYHIPMPVLRQIAADYPPFSQKNPAAALQLSLALWEDAYLETRWLAAALLGSLPVEFTSYVLAQISEWAGAGIEDRLFTPLVSLGLARALQEQPAALLEFGREQLSSPRPPLQRLGLGALLLLAGQPAFQNLPAMYDLIFPFIHGRNEASAPVRQKSAKTPPGSDLRAEILDILATLARRSPGETAYFLRQCLEGSDNAQAAWYTRQTLRAFPVEQQDVLRAALTPERPAPRR